MSFGQHHHQCNIIISSSSSSSLCDPSFSPLMDSTRTKLEIWLFMVLLTSKASLEARLLFGGDLVLGPKVPCLYIFGDSLFDNGNNNDLVAAPKANYHPYGIDFPGGATGRFSNGRNIMDFIVEFLGFKEFIQPFALATDGDLLVGVNYASGGSGILDETGVNLGEVINMNRQLLNHRTTMSRILSLLGSEESAAEHLSKCIYPVGMGNNDYINNYLSPQYHNSSFLFTPQQFAQSLIQDYSQQLRTLYSYGARKVAVFALGKIGCTPAEMENYNAKECVQAIQDYTKLFNDRLKLLVDELNESLSNAKFIYVGATQILINSSDTSITDTTNPCCVVSRAEGQCVPNQLPCLDRKAMAFWDGFHPTEAASMLIAKEAYKALSVFGTDEIDIRRQARF